MRARGVWGALVSIGVLILVASYTPGVGTDIATGYYIRMADKPSSPTTPDHGAVVSMSTNLPDGTLVAVEHEMLDPKTSSGGGCCSAFSGGSLDYGVGGDCFNPPETRSHKFLIRVTAAPGPAKQPDNVYEVLGPKFEKLVGAQVTTRNGVRALVASATYSWPPDTCDLALNSSIDFVPETCGPSSMSIDDDEGGANLNRVAGTPIATLGQMRLCELYNYGTAAFKKANPWKGWRDRTRAWIDAHRPLAKSGFDWYMSAQITKKSSKTLGHEFNSPEWIEVDYLLRGEKVAHARYVARIWYSGYTKWEMAELTLE